ncbi:hypothetical protein Sjap_002289 [Stephania japonica]|uniref:Uncharacterized protein n=1 Tax=Stephania japonica TaxID=461633 RepID=A0AAP0PUE5_9MAGN
MISRMFHRYLSSSSSLSSNLCYLISNPTFLSFAPQPTVAKPGRIKCRGGDEQLNKKKERDQQRDSAIVSDKVIVFKEENYLANWIKSVMLVFILSADLVHYREGASIRSHVPSIGAPLCSAYSQQLYVFAERLHFGSAVTLLQFLLRLSDSMLVMF